MSDFPPPNVPPAAESPAARSHPGPPEGWRPLSGLAITSFVLSLLFILLGLLGLWIGQLIPILLGVLTLKTVKVGQKRGRILAIWAIVIAVGAGSCSYVLHSNMRGLVGHVAESVMSALASKDPAERASALKAWMDPTVLEEHPDRIEQILQRYAEVEERFGPYQGEIELRSPLLGSGIVFLTPEAMAEIGTGDSPPAYDPMGAAWARPLFRDGQIEVAIAFPPSAGGTKHPLNNVALNKAARVVADIRFFRPRAEEAGAGK